MYHIQNNITKFQNDCHNFFCKFVKFLKATETQWFVPNPHNPGGKSQLLARSATICANYQDTLTKQFFAFLVWDSRAKHWRMPCGGNVSEKFNHKKEKSRKNTKLKNQTNDINQLLKKHEKT